MKYSNRLSTIAGWGFGLLFLAIGIVNTFWGNDPGFGIFIALLSCIYFPPITKRLKERTGYAVHSVVKIALGVFIFWAALGVGELFDKIGLMMKDL